MKRYSVILFALVTAISCIPHLEKPENVIGDENQIQSHLQFLATYIIKKPTEISDSAWFSDSLKQYKAARLKDYDVKYLYAETSSDTVYYIIQRQELGRTFENYRLLGGKYLWEDKPMFIEEKFISIRYNKKDLEKVTQSLIPYLHAQEVLTLQNKNRDTLIQWPEKGVFYNRHTHKWDLGEENEFYFLKKMKDSVSTSTAKSLNNSITVP